MKSTMPCKVLCAAVGLTVSLLLPAYGQLDLSSFENPKGRVIRPGEGASALTAPVAGGPGAAVGAFLRARGDSAETAASLRLTSQSRAARTGLTHARFEQVAGGLPVYGAYVKAAVNDRGELTHLIENLAPVPRGVMAPAASSELEALQAAMAQVHPGVAAGFREKSKSGGVTTFTGDTFFHRDPTVTRIAVRTTGGALRAGYLVETWSQKENLLDHTVVGGDGQVLLVERRTNNDSYHVFVEDPLKGSQGLMAGPGAGNAESPSGWLAGSQTTINIRGNNVRAYLDADANNAPDSGGTVVTSGDFLTAVNLGVAPTTAANREVAVQNLFYLNNVVHDVLYRHGFDEAAGNFQVSNFGKDGAENDPVNAEAQDGSGTDNANFATPNDGSSPRMQMYLWNGAGPDGRVTVTSPVLDEMDARIAQFGPAPTVSGLTGSVVLVNDGSVAGGGSVTDACERLPRGSLNGKIALVDRGTCAFTVKVVNAQTAGAVGVIIANNAGTTEIFTMGGTDSKIRIPSVMIGKTDGDALRALTGVTARVAKLDQAPLMIDGDLDSDIVFHEYGHGLTWRMIGSMNGPLAGAVGEGASDVLAFLINGDDRVGEYAFSNPEGIRREPYSVYSLTYADVTGAEVHNDGEIYAAAMWRLKDLYVSAGLSADDLLGDFVNGMNFTPATPAFEDMRDGMLQAVGNSNRRCLIWQAFAQFGIGSGADGTINRRGKLTITESFVVPGGACP